MAGPSFAERTVSPTTTKKSGLFSLPPNLDCHNKSKQCFISLHGNFELIQYFKNISAI